jgi:uncharacterized protein (TIGR02270 family)
MSVATWPAGSDPILDDFITQHTEEASFLWLQRNRLACQPHCRLRDLAKHDERLAAHVGGLLATGEPLWQVWAGRATEEGPGGLFAVTVVALEGRDLEGLEALLTQVEASPSLYIALLSAFGWTAADKLQSVVKHLLTSSAAFRRRIGIACCAMHGVDPKQSLDRAIDDADPLLREQALITVGELGRKDLLPLCDRHLSDSDPSCRLSAAYSAVLNGNRGNAVAQLIPDDTSPEEDRSGGLRLALQAMDIGAAHVVLQKLARMPQQMRALIRGSGIVGDPSYVPWLIGHIANDQTARLAGEAFSLITGADLGELNLEREYPDALVSEPTEVLPDTIGDMNRDEDLPWPDAARINAWWASASPRFQPGRRHFMGAPVTREHCIEVLKNGYQRQRILAAHYLCLLEPGTPLFNTSAPAWRQQRLLAQMK